MFHHILSNFWIVSRVARVMHEFGFNQKYKPYSGRPNLSFAEWENVKKGYRILSEPK